MTDQIKNRIFKKNLEFTRRIYGCKKPIVALLLTKDDIEAVEKGVLKESGRFAGEPLQK